MGSKSRLGSLVSNTSNEASVWQSAARAFRRHGIHCDGQHIPSSTGLHEQDISFSEDLPLKLQSSAIQNTWNDVLDAVCF
jgi:hypothetical protein